MRSNWLRWLAAAVGVAVVTSCTGYSVWLRQTIAARPHLAHRLETPHRVAVLDTGRDALLHRIECIRTAVRSVQIQTFILDDAPSTRLVLHELVLAARRGVRVQLLTDSLFSSQDPAHAARLIAAHPDFELRVYNPPSRDLAAGVLASLGIALVDFDRINQRMHSKLMVIDGALGVCGGRNYQDSYFDEDPRLDYRDRDVAVAGPVVARMQASFDANWTHLASIPVDRLRDVARTLETLPDEERNWPFSPAELGIEELANRIDRLLAGGALKLRWHDVAAVAFWADTPGKPPIDNDPDSVARRLIGAVGAAREEVLIQSPYVVLTDAAIVLLKQIRARGVTVSVHTNSLASTDNWSSYAHAMRQRRELLEYLGLEVFELMPYPEHIARVVPAYDRLRRHAPDDGGADSTPSATNQRGPVLSLHAKSMVIDGELAVIGSYNLDPRSETLNSEALLAVWDADFARELSDAIRLDAAAANSWVVAPRRHSMPRALIADLIGRVNALLKAATTLDVWPVEWTSLFELRVGQEPVSRFDPAFYDRYREVGCFPGVEGTPIQVLVRLTKALTGIARPLM